MSVTWTKAREKNLLEVRPVVTIRILEKEKVGGMSKNHPSPGKGQGSGDVKALGKNGELVRLAVTIGILADLDSVVALPAVLDLIRIVHGFHHPKASPFVPLEIDRIDDLRLGGKQFQLEANRNLRVLHALLGREGKLEWQRLGSALVVRNIVAFLILQGNTSG